MKAIGINGSPRRDNNTGTMLEFALNGAKAQGADIERIDLYDLSYHGCRSCFACKRLGGESFGRCALKDDLSGVLQDAIEADVLIIASPIYFGDVTGQVRCFLERLWFPSLLYSPDGEVAYERKAKVGMIYTMNVADPMAVGYGEFLRQIEVSSERFIGETKTLLATDTYQFADYAEYASGIFDPEHKKRVHEEHFPLDCRQAFDLGERLAKMAAAR